MRKSLLIGLIVCVIAIGGIGAAFATTLGFPGIGALAAGGANIPEVNVDGITWWANNNGGNAYVDTVTLSFDKDLLADTEFGVTIVGSGGSILGNLWYREPSAVPASGSVIFCFFASGGVAGAPGDAILLSGAIPPVVNPPPGIVYGVPIADVYGIRVIVSEETAP